MEDPRIEVELSNACRAVIRGPPKPVLGRFVKSGRPDLVRFGPDQEYGGVVQGCRFGFAGPRRDTQAMVSQRGLIEAARIQG